MAMICVFSWFVPKLCVICLTLLDSSIRDRFLTNVIGRPVAAVIVFARTLMTSSLTTSREVSRI
jgi:hypothetical protein